MKKEQFKHNIEKAKRQRQQERQELEMYQDIDCYFRNILDNDKLSDSEKIQIIKKEF